MKTLSPEALAVLGSMETQGHLATITAGQLDRKVYVETNKALEAIGGKWNRAKKAHVFDGDPRDALDQIVLTGGFCDKKQEFGFFETPKAVVGLLIRRAKLEPGMKVLEPSAGRGAIADEIAGVVGAENVAVCEMQPELRDALRVKGYWVLATDFLSLRAMPDQNPVHDGNEVEKGEETWRPVVGYEEFYEVSAWGRIRRLQTRKGYKAGTFLTPSPRIDGYMNVVLAANGKCKSILLHQIVAQAFIGPCLEGMEVNHKHPDGDRSRCWASNLEYVTSGGNNADQRRCRPSRYAVGESGSLTKLTVDEAVDAKVRLGLGESFRSIGGRLGVTAATIRAIAIGRTWRDEVPLFERIIANPPFSRQADVDHVLHAYSLLAPGGRLVSVMSAGVTFRTTAKTARLMALKPVIEPLPDGAFKESGTNVRTCIVTLEKP